MTYSLIIPIYRNEASLPRLLDAIHGMQASVDGGFEVVFVVDGSPDRCFEILQDTLPRLSYPAQLIAHSRNFGSFPAIRTGLAAARGDYFAVMAADLQEPPALALAFFHALSADECDVAIGTRTGRSGDPLASRWASATFWKIYRRLVVRDMPEGGVDIFGCNRAFRDQLLALDEARSSLIALIFWLGFRRKLFGYERLVRQEGVSAWSLSRKIDYMMDSVFAFTDLPIRLLIKLGAAGVALSVVVSLLVVIGRLAGLIQVPGYAPTMLAVLFFGALNLLGLGLVGTYAWRGYENSKRRPLAVVARRIDHEPGH